MLIGVNILSSLRLGQRYAAHEQLLCRREHGRVFGRLLELYVLNVVSVNTRTRFFRVFLSGKLWWKGL